MEPGIQLSSFAPLMQDEAGLENVLESVSGFGCKNVQLQWIGRTVVPAHVAKLLKAYGIKSLGMQDKNPEIFNDPDHYIELNKACGSHEICVSGIPDDTDFDAYASKFDALKQRCKALDMELSYHPTRTDFADDCRRCRLLLDTFKDVTLCADVCQLNDNGVDPVAFLKTWAGRVRIVHFKDRGVDGLLSVVGEGRTDFKPITQVCMDTGVNYILAEQETWKGDAIESLRRGYSFVSELICGVSI